MIRKRDVGGKTKYEVFVYDPNKRKKRYVGLYDRLGRPGMAGTAKDAEQLAQKKFNAARINGEPTVSQYAKTYIERSRSADGRPWRGSTRNHKRERLQAFVAAFGDQSLSQIDGDAAREWAYAHPNHAPQARTMLGQAARAKNVFTP